MTFDIGEQAEGASRDTGSRRLFALLLSSCGFKVGS